MHALGLEFCSAAQLSKGPGSVWNCLWGIALKISPGIIRKSRVLYPCPGFLSSATWPSLPKKHYNGLNQTILFGIVLGQTPDIEIDSCEGNGNLQPLLIFVSYLIICIFYVGTMERNKWRFLFLFSYPIKENINIISINDLCALLLVR